MCIVEEIELPSHLGEQVMRGQACVDSGHSVVQVYRLLHRHGPELRVGDIRPVDCRVQQHRSTDLCNCSDGSFRHGIVVVSTCSSQLVNLAKFRELVREVTRCESRSLVSNVCLWTNAQIKALEFELLFCHEGLMVIESGLELHIDVPSGLVYKDAPTTIHLIRV